MTIRNELIDELLAGRDPALVMRHDGLLGELKQALLNRLMAPQFDHHMDQERASGEGRNHRNGATRKRVLAGDGTVEITVPRDREARFEPVLIGKYQRRLPGFNDKVISLYARGMSTREIQGHLEDLYGTEVSPAAVMRHLRGDGPAVHWPVAAIPERPRGTSRFCRDRHGRDRSTA
ncbi:transposase, partial [Rhodopila globiformis]|uniref:transposase n=1 Tax=Rhodopila globiformis TaxID=1071 RepID=UPI0018747067